MSTGITDDDISRNMKHLSILITQTSLITRFLFASTDNTSRCLACPNFVTFDELYGFTNTRVDSQFSVNCIADLKLSASWQTFRNSGFIFISIRDLKVSFVIKSYVVQELWMWTTANIETAINSITSTYNFTFICIHSMSQRLKIWIRGSRWRQIEPLSRDIIKQSKLCNKVKDTDRQLLTERASEQVKHLLPDALVRQKKCSLMEFTRQSCIFNYELVSRDSLRELKQFSDDCKLFIKFEVTEKSFASVFLRRLILHTFAFNFIVF